MSDRSSTDNSPVKMQTKRNDARYTGINVLLSNCFMEYFGDGIHNNKVHVLLIDIFSANVMLKQGKTTCVGKDLTQDMDSMSSTDDNDW